MKAFFRENRSWIRLVVKMVILVSILWLLFGVLIGLRRVEGVSMSHRVEDGDLVLFSRTDKAYYPDDVVLFERENETLISSILASPGDVVSIDELGRLYVNGAQVSDRAVYNSDEGEQPGISFPVTVPRNSYFLLNENYEDMNDSRTFGVVPKVNIKGKVFTILRTRSI